MTDHDDDGDTPGEDLDPVEQYRALKRATGDPRYPRRSDDPDDPVSQYRAAIKGWRL
jgi:hypothetical protein